MTGTASDPERVAELGLSRSRYEGPTGIVGVLSDAFRQAGLASASLWASVPHYVATPPNPRATHALLERLGTLLDVTLPLRSLEIAGAAWVRQVDEVAAGDDDISRYVRELEARQDAALFDDEEGDEDDDDSTSCAKKTSRAATASPKTSNASSATNGTRSRSGRAFSPKPRRSAVPRGDEHATMREE